MSYSSVIAALPGVVGHWLFGETSGTTAAAAIGPSGTYTGSPTLNVSSPSGLTPGISVTGGSRVVIPGSANWAMGTGDFWVVFWFKTTQTGQKVILGSNSGRDWIEVTSGVVKARAYSGGDVYANGGSGLNDNNWHMALVTRVSGVTSVYIDGGTTAAGSASMAGQVNYGDASTAITLGGFSDGSFNFVGSIDGLAIGKGAGLTGTDSAAIYAAGSSAGSFSLSPTSITAGTTGNSITLTGTGTSWTSGTPGSPTFTLSGGTGASITAQTVASATSATITVTAGSAAGTLTITDPSTGATQSLAVNAAAATAFTLTGPSSGTVNTASTNFTFTPNGTYTGTITPSMTGLAGSWTPSSLTWSSASDAKTATFTPTATGTGTANGVASPSLTQPSSVSYTSNNGPLTAGSLTLASQGASGPVLTISNGTGGVPTLTHYLHRSNAGKGFTPSGTSAGSGTCIAVNPSSSYTDSTLSTGNGAWYLLRTIDSAASSADSSYVAGTTYSGSISLGGVGDSRMALPSTCISGVADVLARNGWGRTTASTNRGYSSSSPSPHWVPGASVYNDAVTAFNAAGTTHIIFDLTTNPAIAAVSPSTWRTQASATIAGLFNDVPTLTRIYISYGTQILPVTSGDYATTLGYNASLRAYQAEIDAMAAADPTRLRVIGKSLYGLTATVAGFMNSDGLHESNTGTTVKTNAWINDIVADLAGSGSSGSGPVPSIGNSPFIRGIN